MKPVDYRDATWEMVRGRVEGLRGNIYLRMLEHGLANTTREWSEILNVDLLTLRPRITELVQLGFVELVQTPGAGKHEGSYRAVSEYMARLNFDERCRVEREPQLELKF